VDVNRMGEGGPAVTVSFEIDGQQFVALNGGPQFAFTEALSLFVSCEDQAEVDDLWDRLSEGGEQGRCGWLKDRYGVSWQVIPTALGELMGDPDPEKAGRVVQAMLGMTKIEVKGLQDAYDGRA
jgi:predicted 3-demethylubiquinone-9 3-methyltransferase (glyoxalase superfamily)